MDYAKMLKPLHDYRSGHLSYSERLELGQFANPSVARAEERRVAAMSPEAKFAYVENLIIKLHKDSYERDQQYVDCRATFDDWKDQVAAFKARIHDAVVKYYAELDFVKRYNLDRYPWAKDKDVVALIQILQVRGRAKAAAKLEKLEAEIDGIAAKIAKLESGGRYYREDVITLNATFDRVRVSLRVENDRGRKRQQTIEKVAAAPLKAAEKTYEFGCGLIAILFGIGLTVGVPIIIILHIFGVIK